jgi:hypothetical protein
MTISILVELASLIFGVFLLDGKVHQHHCETSKHILCFHIVTRNLHDWNCMGWTELVIL